ncbi:MAG: hypothetical protein VB876_14105 [Pirellulales bacterium]
MSRIDVSPSLVQVLCLWLPCGVHSVYQLSQQAIVTKNPQLLL